MSTSETFAIAPTVRERWLTKVSRILTGAFDVTAVWKEYGPAPSWWDATKREITITGNDPVPANDVEQHVFAKGKVFHEIAHVLFTEPVSPAVILARHNILSHPAAKDLWNILEDGRIERLLAVRYPGAGKFIRSVLRAFGAPKDPWSDLVQRVRRDTWTYLPGSPFEPVDGLIREALAAPSSDAVARITAEILRKIKLPASSPSQTPGNSGNSCYPQKGQKVQPAAPAKPQSDPDEDSDESDEDDTSDSDSDSDSDASEASGNASGSDDDGEADADSEDGDGEAGDDGEGTGEADGQDGSGSKDSKAGGEDGEDGASGDSSDSSDSTSTPSGSSAEGSEDSGGTETLEGPAERAEREAAEAAEAKEALADARDELSEMAAEIPDPAGQEFDSEDEATHAETLAKFLEALRFEDSRTRWIPAQSGGRIAASRIVGAVTGETYRQVQDIGPGFEFETLLLIDVSSSMGTFLRDGLGMTGSGIQDYEYAGAVPNPGDCSRGFVAGHAARIISGALQRAELPVRTVIFGSRSRNVGLAPSHPEIIEAYKAIGNCTNGQPAYDLCQTILRDSSAARKLMLVITDGEYGIREDMMDEFKAEGVYVARVRIADSADGAYGIAAACHEEHRVITPEEVKGIPAILEALLLTFAQQGC